LFTDTMNLRSLLLLRRPSAGSMRTTCFVMARGAVWSGDRAS
jgi:hypothetical protein